MAGKEQCFIGRTRADIPNLVRMTEWRGYNLGFVFVKFKQAHDIVLDTNSTNEELALFCTCIDGCEASCLIGKCWSQPFIALRFPTLVSLSPQWTWCRIPYTQELSAIFVGYLQKKLKEEEGHGSSACDRSPSLCDPTHSRWLARCLCILIAHQGLMHARFTSMLLLLVIVLIPICCCQDVVYCNKFALVHCYTTTNSTTWRIVSKWLKGLEHLDAWYRLDMCGKWYGTKHGTRGKFVRATWISPAGEFSFFFHPSLSPWLRFNKRYPSWMVSATRTMY